MRLAVPAVMTLAALLAAAPRPADACSPVTYDLHQLDATHAGDHTPPDRPEASIEIFRDHASGGCATDTCGDLSSIVLHANARDDATPAERLGFRVRVIDGSAPIAPPTEDIRPQFGDEMRFFMDDRRGFSFTLEVRAVDLNGNVGPPVLVLIDDVPPETSGCAIAPGMGSLASLGLVVVALALAMRRRGR